MTRPGAQELPPSTGAWRDGDPPGRRQWYTSSTPLSLECGDVLPSYCLAYETWGELAPDGSNAVLVLHALTGDSHVSGASGPGHPTQGWWDGLVGPGKAFDPTDWFIVAPNALGGCQGSTGPASTSPDGSPWGSRFPNLTIRDLVEAEVGLADELGIGSWALVVGGSMGGMRALEWAIMYPHRVRRVAAFATTAQASAEQIAWTSIQVNAIRSDAGWRGGDYYFAPRGCGPHRGLGVARRVAHVTYRAEPELAARFGRQPQPGEDPIRGGRFAVESYLDHHADKLARRFDAGSYVRLSEAMNSHDVGRGRCGVDEALRRITATALVVGVDSDRIYPLYQQEELVAAIPAAKKLRMITSASGHDGFLIETGQVSDLLTDLVCGPS